MGIAVMILGKSGAGKSTSLRNLDPQTYSVVEVNGKPLPFKTKKRTINTDVYANVSRVLQEAPCDIVVVDDSQYLMANEFMRRAREKGFEKFTEIGVNFWNLVNEVSKLPENKIVYFLHHLEVDEFGNSKEKTIGKLLDDKICIAGMFSIVILAEKRDKEFVFDTQNDGQSPAKTPIGMFPDRVIENDLVLVDKAIRGFYDLPEPTKMEAKPE
ncbi:MAG TPA: AAA family ATPase [Treponemataceae bacterium]|nr:AAA family ATPase [Treponemataceae bacterium]HQF74440.1 AAA family ATPase [Treponemataceae bacterium]HRR03249.1 AAA family ATPase [Treponemataceae bacterium]